MTDEDSIIDIQKYYIKIASKESENIIPTYQIKYISKTKKDTYYMYIEDRKVELNESQYKELKVLIEFGLINKVKKFN